MLDWRSGYIIVLLTGALLAFLIFSWDKATGLSAEEKAEIGILKSLGWETSEVLMIKFWEGAVISFSAFLLGVIGAYLHVFWASAPLFEHALKGWAVLYPRFRLDPTVSVYQLAVLFFFTVIPYALVTMIPAWKASVTDPDTMMRQG
jgi:ABC-type lipoprotein release transport system permease subunit